MSWGVTNLGSKEEDCLPSVLVKVLQETEPIEDRGERRRGKERRVGKEGKIDVKELVT